MPLVYTRNRMQTTKTEFKRYQLRSVQSKFTAQLMFP
jgi:hypothetical protein